MEKKMKYKSILGHGSIPESESLRAKTWGKFFFKARIFILLFLSFQWYLELHDIFKTNQICIYIANIFVLTYFCLETIILTFSLENKKYHLIRNWPTPLIIAFLITTLLYPLSINEQIVDGIRLLIIVWLSIPCIEICVTSLSDNKLSTTIFAAAFFIIFAGVIISGLDPAIKNPWDGIWWAWVTITTVGYGDIVPSSIIGKTLTFPLMLTGLLLFAAFTANFSALFVKHRLKKNLAEIVKEEHQIIKMMKQIQSLTENIEKLEKHVTDIKHDLKQQNK